MFRLYVLNTAFAVLRLLLLMAVVSQVTLVMGTVLVAQFFMVRRYSGLFANLIQAGVSQYYIRFVPATLTSPTRWWVIVRRGLIFWFLHASVLLAVAVLAYQSLPVRLFGNQASAETAYIAFVALSAALSVDYLARSLALAMQRVIWANAAELLGGSILLLILLPRFADDLQRLFLLQALAILVLALSLLLALGCVALRRRTSQSTSKLASSALPVAASSETATTPTTLALRDATVRQSAVYAWTRNAGALTELVLTSLGLWMLRDDLQAAAAFALLITIVKVIQLAATPVSQIMAVSHAHRPVGNRDASAMLAALLRLFALTLPFAYAGSERLLGWWLHNAELVADIHDSLGIALIGVLGYAISQVVKGAADVMIRLPFNLICNTSAVGVHLLVTSYLMQNGVSGVPAATAGLATAFALLGLASWLFVRRQLAGSITRRDWWVLAMLTATSYTAGYMANALFTHDLLLMAGLVAILHLSLAASVIGRQVFRVRELTA